MIANTLVSQDEPGFSVPDQKFFGLLLLLILSLTVVDISVDLVQGVSPIHILIEGLLIPLTGFGLCKTWGHILLLRSNNRSLQVDLAHEKATAMEWRTEASKHLAGLAAAIDAQLSRWNLSKAEKDIALLLLKGLSHKEIAEIRKTSERTVRQQALAVYSKSNLGGRTQLSAFFLEDLLTPA